MRWGQAPGERGVSCLTTRQTGHARPAAAHRIREFSYLQYTTLKCLTN
jgi:hypothetical protein